MGRPEVRDGNEGGCCGCYIHPIWLNIHPSRILAFLGLDHFLKPIFVVDILPNILPEHPVNISSGWPLAANVLWQPIMDTRRAPLQHPTPICNILLHFGPICRIPTPPSCQHPTKLSGGVCRRHGSPPTSHQHPTVFAWTEQHPANILRFLVRTKAIRVFDWFCACFRPNIPLSRMLHPSAPSHP